MMMMVGDDHPASRYRSADGAIFSSSKCPPGPENYSCELPFGFLWTPLAPPRLPMPINNDDDDETPPTSSLPPVLCVTCLAYLNLYCKVDEITGHWICPFCQCQNVAPVKVLEKQQLNTNMLMISPTVEFRQQLLKSSTAPPIMVRPEVHETVVVVLDLNLPAAEAQAVGTMMQSILQSDNNDAKGSRNLGLIMFGKNVSIYQLGISSSGMMASADVVCSHEGLTIERLKERSYLTTSDDTTTLLTCIAAQFGVAAADSSSDMNGVAPHSTTATTAPKSRMQLLKERKEARLRKQQQQEEVGDEDSQQEDYYLSNGFSGTSNGGSLRSPWTVARETVEQTAPPYRCTGEAIQCAVDLVSVVEADNSNFTSARVTPSRTARILLFTNGCPNLGDGSVVDNSAEYESSTHNSSGGPTTTMPEKPKAAALYSTVDPAKLARASEYFELIAKAAAEGGIGIDVFCTGSSELGLPAYQSLVEPSSGYVISHDSFTTPHVKHNVSFLLKHTSMSLALFEEEEEEENHPETEHRENTNPVSSGHPPHYGTWIEGCTVDIRTSSFLNPTHLIGPGDLVESPDGPLVTEQSAFDQGAALATEQLKQHRTKVIPSLEMLESSLTRIRLGRYDPLSTFSVMLRLNDFFQHDEYAFFQCIVRYVDPKGQTLTTRVTTHRLSVAKDVGEFLEAIDEEVVPVLLGKEAVYRSMFGRDVNVEQPFLAPHTGQLDTMAYDAQRDLDHTVFRISGAFRLLSLEKGTRTIDLTEEGGIKAAGSSMDFAFPPELSDALRRLYHLRRGPFLSPGPLQSIDDRAEMRALFVRFPLEDCLGMMAPTLWTSGPLEEALAGQGPSLEQVPPETLSLWENRIIAADHYHSLFVWSGSATTAPENDSTRQQLQKFLLDRTQKRFPAPNFHFLTEKDSMSRRFTALLAPSHGDPVEHQLAHFPALNLLSAEEQSKLNARYHFYDPESDPSFRKWFWEVASAVSDSSSEGVSLCD